MCVFVWARATVGFSLRSLWFIEVKDSSPSPAPCSRPIMNMERAVEGERERRRVNEQRRREKTARFFILIIFLTFSFDRMMTFNWFCQQTPRTRLFHRYYSCCIYDLCDVFAAEDRKHWLMWISVGSETRSGEFPGSLKTPHFLSVFIPFSASHT